MFDVQNFLEVRMQLASDVQHYRNEIEFYLALNDTLSANKFELKLNRLINRFNSMYDMNLSEKELISNGKLNVH